MVNDEGLEFVPLSHITQTKRTVYGRGKHGASYDRGRDGASTYMAGVRMGLLCMAGVTMELLRGASITCFPGRVYV